MLSGEEKSALDYWIEHIDQEHTAKAISELSHDYGWEIAKLGEELPLSAFMASVVRHPNETEMSHLQKD